VASVSPLSMQACSNCAGDYEDPDRTAVPGDLSEQSEGDDVDEVGEVEVEVEVDAHARARTSSRELREKDWSQ